MIFSTILVDVDDSVGVVTLNRPEIMNAWNVQMAIDLSNALKALNENDSVRAIVITGAGKAFCAGADLSGGDKSSLIKEDEAVDRRTALAFPAIMPWAIPKPVLAAINGHAIGVGITYPMTCDIRFVAEDAKVQFAFVRRGITPELASHCIVARVAGLSNAADLLLSGRMIRGRELAEMGLASKAMPAEEVLPAAIERAREFKKTAPISVAISKRLIWEGLTSSIVEMDQREFTLFDWVCRQPDAVEGISSFLEKRDPAWKMSVNRDMPDSFKPR